MKKNCCFNIRQYLGNLVLISNFIMHEVVLIRCSEKKRDCDRSDPIEKMDHILHSEHRNPNSGSNCLIHSHIAEESRLFLYHFRFFRLPSAIKFSLLFFSCLRSLMISNDNETSVWMLIYICILSSQMFPFFVLMAFLENGIRLITGKGILRVNDSIASLSQGVFQECLR